MRIMDVGRGGIRKVYIRKIQGLRYKRFYDPELFSLIRNAF